MDELVKSLQLPETPTSALTIWSVLIALVVSGGASAAVGLVYRRVYAEAGYSQTLVQSFVIVAMITAIIMEVVGSNIARAFSLVGALSIIRFRSAIKSPFDIAFIFLAVAIGMAAGTGFYAVAIVGTAFILATVVVMHRFNFAAYPERREFLLSIQLPIDVPYETALAPILEKFLEGYSLSYTETVRQGALREVVYSVRPRAKIEDQQLIDAVRAVNRDNKVSFRQIRHAIDVP